LIQALQPPAKSFFKPPDAFRIEAVAGGGALDLALDQAGFAQDFEVLADGGLGQRGGEDNCLGHTGWVGGEILDNPKANWVSQRFQHAHQALPVSG
jgi:hypothetical protein